MIKIKEEEFIAEGISQKCYMHPENKNLCIKIGKEDLKTSRLGNELKHFKKISKKKINKLDYLFFTKYYNQIQTNFGTGYVYDLVRDETTGEVSKTMAYYLLDKDSKYNDAILHKAFDRLIKMMIKYKVMVSDLRSNNICCKILKDESIEMIIVDGVGHKDLVPLAEWFSFFSEKKIKRRVARYHLNDFDKQRQFLKESVYGQNKN